MERNRNRISRTIGFAIVLAISASLLTLGAPAVWAGEREYDEIREAKADGVVYVENIAGSIRVEGWEKNQVHVTGILDNRIVGSFNNSTRLSAFRRQYLLKIFRNSAVTGRGNNKYYR